jgi:folate-binding protein YgfZ
MANQHSTSTPTNYEAVRHHAGVFERTDLGRLVVSGRDRAAYLQGLLTNDIGALGPGQGCYAAYLTAQGRMITDLHGYELGAVMVLTRPLEVKDSVLKRLDQFIFSEDVQLGDVTGAFASRTVIGPEAAEIVSHALQLTGSPALAELPEHGNLRTQFSGLPIVVLKVTDTGEPGFELMIDPSEMPGLAAALHSAGAADIDPALAEVLRVEAGVPKFHRDMDEETIPLEAGIESRAISQTKGCYVGQEVIIRVLHRGHGRVARRLVGLAFDGGEVPAPEAVVIADGREAGRITSAVLSPALARPIALAYLHRDFTEPGAKVTVNGAGGVVTSLPFVRASTSR